MCSDKFFLKHALAYSAKTFIIAALAALLLFCNVSCRPFDKKPIYKPAMQNFQNFWGFQTPLKWEEIGRGRAPIKLIYIGAELGLPLPVSGAMFFNKDVILLLMFACCSYDVIYVALMRMQQKAHLGL